MGKKHLLITCLITLLCTLCFFCILCSNNIFSLYTDYNSDNKEREKLLREIISSIKSEIKYSKNDAIALVGDSPDDLTNTVFYADICTRESAQMLFQCIENCESISDISNTPQHHGYLPIKINGIGLCDFNCLDIELQHTHQLFCIKFAKNDSEALYEYFHKMGNTLKEDANTRADLLEEAIKVYDSMIDYYDSDYISVVENNNRIFVDNIVIRTPETAKMLFNCIRNATIINDYTGVPLKPEKPEIFINEEPIGTFNHVYLLFPPTGRYLFFSFSEEDSKSLYEYVVNTKYEVLEMVPEKEKPIISNSGTNVDEVVAVAELENVEIVIPSIEEVRVNGYPVNELGETYGPETKDDIEQPDLILVCNELGQVGYIRQSDIDYGISTPEEAANYKPRQYTVNMYTQDGSTIVGMFTIGTGG